MRRVLASVVVAVVGSILAGCSSDAPRIGMDPSAKRVAEELTSIWENDTPVLQYGYAEDIGDGRGYTAGRAGFTSGTGDLRLVVRCLDQATGSRNRLHRYLRALDRLDRTFERTGTDQADTSTLDRIGDLPADWRATDRAGRTRTAFRRCQDRVVDDQYYGPAMLLALAHGVRTELTKAVLYDTTIQHGLEGAAAIALRADRQAGPGHEGGARPRAGESRWLRAFLRERRRILRGDPTWAGSDGRVVNYEHLRQTGNWKLDRPFRTLATDVGYTRYRIRP